MFNGEFIGKPEALVNAAQLLALALAVESALARE